MTADPWLIPIRKGRKGSARPREFIREVVYHRHAVRYLRKMPLDRKDQVKQAFSEVAKLVDPLEHPNVRMMTGE